MIKWNEGTLNVVRGVWACAIASVMVWVTMTQIFPILAEDGLDKIEMGFIGGLLLFAFVAALPSVFMQVIGKGVEVWRERKKGGGE